jgi:hypothetical protein
VHTSVNVQRQVDAQTGPVRMRQGVDEMAYARRPGGVGYVKVATFVDGLTEGRIGGLPSGS